MCIPLISQTSLVNKAKKMTVNYSSTHVFYARVTNVTKRCARYTYSTIRHADLIRPVVPERKTPDRSK